MSRLLAALSVLVVALAPAAPIPPPPKTTPLYFPTRVGTKRVYLNEEDKSERVELVTKVEDKDGAKLVTTQCDRDGVGECYLETVVSDQGLAIVRVEVIEINFQLDRPLWVLKVPLKAGSKWDFELAHRNLAGWSGTAIVEVHEKVTVPAGVFEAVRVKSVTASNPSQVITTWYAPHVGVVKVIKKAKSGEAVEVLKSFRPGKD